MFEKMSVEEIEAKPLLKGYENKEGIIVWCPFCKEFHQHGKGEGYRKQAHCTNPDSPFLGIYKKGYVIKIYTDDELIKLGLKKVDQA